MSPIDFLTRRRTACKALQFPALTTHRGIHFQIHMHTKPRHAHHQGPRSSKKRNISRPLASQNTTAACDPSTALPWRTPQRSHNLILFGLIERVGGALVGLAFFPACGESAMSSTGVVGGWSSPLSRSRGKAIVFSWASPGILDVCERFFTSLHVLVSLRCIRVSLILLRMLVCV
jgi:hypothetical protein